MTRNIMLFAPALVFAILAGFWGVRLFTNDGPEIPSALLSRPAPEFDLPPLLEGGEGLSTADLSQGEVSVVNLWASWCGPCRVEHPELMELGEMGVAEMYSLNYKDKPEPARRFLEQLGDPFDRIGVDESGQTSLRWGITGVPETFVIDGAGRVVYKHVGPIQNNDLEDKILPAIDRARNAS